MFCTKIPSSHHVLDFHRISRYQPTVPKSMGQWDNTLYYILFKLNLYSKDVGIMLVPNDVPNSVPLMYQIPINIKILIKMMFCLFYLCVQDYFSKK